MSTVSVEGSVDQRSFDRALAHFESVVTGHLAGGPDTMLKGALRLKAHAAEAGATHGFGSPEARRAAAQYGAYVTRGWRSWLVRQLTRAVIDAAGLSGVTSRERVREWQRRVFGTSISSSDLDEYALPSAGDRGEPIAIAPLVEARAKAVYEAYSGALKQAAIRAGV
jgi:hypothetical protein